MAMGEWLTKQHISLGQEPLESAVVDVVEVCRYEQAKRYWRHPEGNLRLTGFVDFGIMPGRSCSAADPQDTASSGP